MKSVFSATFLMVSIMLAHSVSAAKYNYFCQMKEPQFKPSIVFSYDDQVGTFKLVEAYGDILRADQTTSPPHRSDGIIEFSLDSTHDGYVEMRDNITYNFDKKHVYIARFFLNKDGSLSGRGPVVDGKCITGIATQTGAPATNFRKAAPEPMTVIDAKIAIGFDPATAKYSLATGASFKFGIVDFSFSGLKAWLEDNPEFKSRIHYKNLRKDGKPSGGNHGFEVFKVAAEIMPSAQFYLYETGRPVKELETILVSLQKDNVFFASMSLGVKQYMGGSDPSLIYKNLELLDKYQISFLVSSGNQRGDNHFFSYSDVDEDGKLEFASTPKANGKLLEYNRIYFSQGSRLNLNLSWNEFPERVSDFEIQLVDKENTVVASASALGPLPVIELFYKAVENQALWLKLVNKSAQTPSPDLKFGMFVRGPNTSRALLNGQESMGIMAQFESPFLTVVGSFGQDKSGHLQPSNFSSIGHTNTGQIGPHILGPGQFLIDGKQINGTSFATPFIAALYSVFGSYNIKNVIEATATKAKLTAGLVPEEQSRWGTPDANTIFSNICDQSNKIENLRSSIEADKLVVEFDFTRDCMEGLDYYLHAYVRGEKPISAEMFAIDLIPVAGAPKQKLRGWVKNHSKTRTVVAEPMRIEMPFKHIPRHQFGRPISLSFKISTRAQWDPVAIYSKSPELKITLPMPSPLSGEILVGKLAQKANRAVELHRFPDAIQLATLALETPALSVENSALARNSRAMASIGLHDLAGLEAFARDDVAALPDSPIAALRLGDILLSQHKFTAAHDQFKSCLNEKGDDLFHCQIGYIVASLLSGLDARGEIAATYDNSGAALANSPSMHGKALAVFLGHLSGREYRDYFLDVARANMGKPKAVQAISSGSYYLGLMGFSGGNKKIALDGFHQSAASGAVSLEAAVSKQWLDILDQ